MSRRLGEILVEDGVLTPLQLKRALDTQRVLGGRLGTNLLELGFTTDKQLDDALRVRTGFEVASVAQFEAASSRALRLVHTDFASQHGVLPLSVKDQHIRVAMLDPGDLIIVDELGFVTGLHVDPLVAPERRMHAYLEHYYRIQRPKRQVAVALAPVAPGRAKPGLDDGALSVRFGDGYQDYQGAEETIAIGRYNPQQRLAASSPASLAPKGEPVLTLPELLGLEQGQAVTPQVLRGAVDLPQDRRDQIDRAFDQLAERRTAEATAADAAVQADVRTLADVARRLAEAGTREDVGNALVRFAGNMFPRVMAFVVQKDRALGWMARLPGRDAEAMRQEVRGISLDLGAPSVVSDLASTGHYYLGELPGRPGDEILAAALGAPRPRNVIAMPIQLNERVVIALIGDNLDAPLGAFDLRSLRAACQAAELAMRVLLLRSRIRQVD